MNWFGRKAAQASARPALSRVYGAWSAPAPLSFEAQLREGYLANPIVQRSVRLVAEAAGSAPVEASDPGLAALVAATSGGQGLLETLASQLLLHGNGYVQILADGAGAPAELFALRPERVTVEADARGWPVAYRYSAGGSGVTLPAEDGAGRTAVVHVKALHPLDDHYGAGCLGAAAAAIAAHNAATRWNAALLGNAARPSGVLVHDPGEKGVPLSAEQVERLREELAEGFAGGANAGRPLLLEGGLKWQALSLSPAEMDFLELKHSAAREIAMAFGVPPMLLGLPGDATYANYKEANRALWRLTVLPLAGKILGAIAQGLRGWFPGAALAVDLNKVPALVEERMALWREVSAADWLTADEKKAMLGVG
ncbi:MULTISPECIES: phage portal protein [unclassified Sphingopyxis]|uniref:phage portal protein n=1 Tax=unclassified Sphingopyxis TaxID=2614943 RepID=UPI00073712A7|nr:MULTISPECIES: phage portal protein [unclassified Sphingopyxis]KTE28758.1 portal protein [Sphingopyxis sp. HIX]KTE74067.1 portal protein [Sphingopyxis sp. HXXIV]